MWAFGSAFVTTVVIALVLLALMIIGLVIGKTLRDRKDAKEAAAKDETTDGTVE